MLTGAMARRLTLDFLKTETASGVILTTAALLAGVLASTTVFALCGRWPRTSRGQASAGWGSPKSAAASSPS